MKYTFKHQVQLNLDIINRTAVYSASGYAFDLTLPLEMVITSDACAYTCATDGTSIIDEAPETLGYYWIDNDVCVRTAEGLVFKTASTDEKPQQTRYSNGQITHQVVDWAASKMPEGHPQWQFQRLNNQPAILNQTVNGEWFITIDSAPFQILVTDLDIEIEATMETGFERIENAAFYYGRPLKAVDASTFEVLNINYARDKNRVYHADNVVPCDYGSFVALNHSVGKDKSQVYSGAIPFTRADVESFRLAGRTTSTHYFADKSHVYCGTTELAGADPDTLTVLSEYYAKDASYVFRFSERLDHLDAATFTLIDDKYCRDKNGIYRCEGDTPRICGKADDFIPLEYGYFQANHQIHYFNDYQDKSQFVSDNAKDFQLLSGYWCTDGQKIFYLGETITDADPKDFENLGDEYVRIRDTLYFRGDLLEADTASFEVLEAGFARDKDHLFYLDEPLEGSTPAGFFVIDDTQCADARQVYLTDDRFECIANTLRIPDHLDDLTRERIIVREDDQLVIDGLFYVGGHLIENADIDTYETLIFGFSKDKNTAYYAHKPLPGMTGDAEVLGHDYITDGVRVYFENIPLPLDADALTVVRNNMIKDGTTVFRRDVEIDGADAKTFERVDHFFERDKRRYYHWGSPIALNIQHAEVLDEVYVIDDERIYYLDTLMDDVDLKSFEPLEGRFARDCDRVYFQGTPLNGVDAASFEITGFNQSQDKNSLYGFRQGEHVKLRDR